MRYEIDNNKLVNDYNNLEKEQELALEKELAGLQNEVASKLQELRPKIEAEIRQAKEKKVAKEFAEKKAFFERYIEIIKENIENEQDIN